MRGIGSTVIGSTLVVLAASGPHASAQGAYPPASTPPPTGSPTAGEESASALTPAPSAPTSSATAAPPPVGSTAPAATGTAAAGTGAAPADATPPAAASGDADSEDDDDDDDGNWFWIDAAVGYSWVNLVALNQDQLVPETDTVRSSGIVFEGGAGFEVSILRIGVAGSYAQYGGFDIATAELDLQLFARFPLVQPYIELGFGYGWVRNVDETSAGGTSFIVPIRGIAADLALGLDLALAEHFQLGIAVDASVLNLQRQRVTDLGTVTNVDFTQPGNSVGLQIHGFLRATLQF